jgi:predicted regulator of Ras-like GTPase activity (Roadblock/LC7/MglB family)
MQELDQLLAYLVNNVDGALSAAVGGMDGLLIEQYPQQAQGLSALAAETTNILVNTRNAYSGGLSGGALREVIVTTEKYVGYTRLLNDELFCLVIMNPVGNIGKARLYSAQAAKRILEVFV